VTDLLESALEYARQHLTVFPLRPRSKAPFGKHECSAPAHEHGFEDATADTAAIAAWWTAHPAANIGLATGRGIDVLDIDGPEGEKALEELVARRWSLPPTSEVRTGRADGGRHLYFLSAGWPNTTSKLGPKLDTKGLGGYVILPPSIHPTGNKYEWTRSEPAAHAPAWITQMLLAAPPAPVAAARPTPPRSLDRYVAAAVRGAIECVSGAPEGTRNETLNTEAFSMGQLVGAGVLEAGYITEELALAAMRAGLPEGEARYHADRGVRDGTLQPRQIGVRK
jgi:hypothetical protein